MEKIWVVTENYRNEKDGDSTEQIKVLGSFRTNEEALRCVKENYEASLKTALDFFDEEDLYTETGPYGSEVYLNYEWDTFHADYTIHESNI